MRHPPSLKYSGLTVVLGVPSRHDKFQLISGYAGQFFESTLYPLNRDEIDIRTADEPGPWLDGTKVVMLLGPEALDLCFPGHQLMVVRGHVFRRDGIIYIPSFTPQDAFDRKNYFSDEDEGDEDESKGDEKNYQTTKRTHWRFWLYSDTKKAIRILREGPRFAPVFDYIFKPEIPIEELLHTRDRYLYIDIETDVAKNLTCFGFGFLDDPDVIPDGTKIWVVPFKTINNGFHYDNLHRFLRDIDVAMRRNVVVSHNGAAFDHFVLSYKYRIPYPHRAIDTMLAHHRCFPELEKSLAHCISYYTDQPYHKDEGILDPKTPAQEQQLWSYNGKDISTLMLVYRGIRAKAKELKAEESVAQAMTLIRPFGTIMLQGIKVNSEKLVEKFNRYERLKTQYQRILGIITRCNLNPRSPAQVSTYLYERLGFDRPASDPTKEENLLRLLNKHNIPSIRVIIENRGLSKKAGSLKFRLWNRHGTWRATTCYGLAGTDTLRLSSKALFRFRSDKGLGTNLQNQHKDNRDIYCADDGKTFIQIDQAGAEAKIVAYLAKPGRFRALFENGIKPHVYMTARLFPGFFAAEMGWSNLDEFLECPIEEIPKLKYWPELNLLIGDSGLKYDSGKMVIHAANYGMKGPTFQINALKKSDNKLILTIQECNAYLKIHRDTFPEIPDWWQEIRETLENGRVLYNLFGYPRRFTEPWGDSLFKQAYAFIPQSTVGCITNIAITEIQQRIEDNDALLGDVDILQNGHDSILLQAPSANALEVARTCKKHLERTFNYRGTSFTMGTEVAIGRNWGPYKKDLNEEGLKAVKKL